MFFESNKTNHPKIDRISESAVDWSGGRGSNNGSALSRLDGVCRSIQQKMRNLFAVIFLLNFALVSGASAQDPSKQEVEMVWRWLSNTSEQPIHQLRGKTGNKVYLHKDGHKEAVYDSDGKLVKDGINDGSYNYAHPVEEPLKHFNQDILPWILMGSSRTDPTSVKERLEAYSRALGIGLQAAQQKPKGEVPQLTQTEISAVRFFLEVVRVGSVEVIFDILKDPKFEPKEPRKVGKGLTDGLSQVVALNKYKPVRPEKK